MLGISYHSPAVLTVLIDRNKFRTENIAKVDPTNVDKVKDFLSLDDDGRQKVLFVEEIQALSVLARGGISFKTLKIVVFDSADKLLRLGDAVKILDAKLEDSTKWIISKITPDDFNHAVESDPTGTKIPVDSIDADPMMDPKENKLIKKKLKEFAANGLAVTIPDLPDDENREEVVENLLSEEAAKENGAEEESDKKAEDKKSDEKKSDSTVESEKSSDNDKPKKIWEPKSGQLSGMLSDVISPLDKADRIAFRKATLQYAAGLIDKKEFSAAKKAVISAGASKESIVAIQEDLESAFGEKIYSAYYDVSKYGTPADSAAKEAGVDSNELKFIIAFVPPDSDHEFCWPAPPSLEEKRGKKKK